jgi:hypothetical protein
VIRQRYIGWTVQTVGSGVSAPPWHEWNLLDTQSPFLDTNETLCCFVLMGYSAWLGVVLVAKLRLTSPKWTRVLALAGYRHSAEQTRSAGRGRCQPVEPAHSAT